MALISLAMHFKSKTRTLENWLDHAKNLENVHIQLFALKNCTTYASGHEEHRRSKEGADLK